MTNKPDENGLLPCMGCGQKLTISGGANPYGRCFTSNCWIAERNITLPLHDKYQVTQWNTRAQPIDKAAESDVDSIAEQVYNSLGHKEGMGGTWQEMKDRFIGDDKPRNCWKGLYAQCMKVANELTSRYYMTEKAKSIESDDECQRQRALKILTDPDHELVFMGEQFLKYMPKSKSELVSETRERYGLHYLHYQTSINLIIQQYIGLIRGEGWLAQTIHAALSVPKRGI